MHLASCTAMTPMAGCWTRPTSISDLDLNALHYRITGWCAVETGGGVRELRDGTEHPKMKNGNHRVLVDSKLNLDRVDEKVVINAMRKHGLFY